ncbi:MAG: carbon-nitrogen hydrolase family protein [Pseudomonadota bacterium]
MLLGLYQMTSPAGDLSAGVGVVNRALGRAAAQGVGMLVLPELAVPGYGACVSGAAPQVQHQVAALAARHKVALTIGLPELADGVVYNSAYTFGPDGQVLARHRKIQLFGPDEARAFVPGNAYCTFQHQGIRFGLLICYDVEFPEHVRALARLGAQVILVPTANMMPFVNVNQIAVPARAFENGVTVVYANYCGTEGALSYTGLSGIFGPDGYLLGGKGQGEGLCVAECPNGWSEHGIPTSTQLSDIRRIGEHP